jgi:hypothetical protein
MLLRRYKDRRENMTTAADLTSAAVTSEEKPLEEMTVDELKVYAKENDIELGRSSSQDGILKKIQDALEEEQEPEDEVDEVTE